MSDQLRSLEDEAKKLGHLELEEPKKAISLSHLAQQLHLPTREWVKRSREKRRMIVMIFCLGIIFATFVAALFMLGLGDAAGRDQGGKFLQLVLTGVFGVLAGSGLSK